MKLRILLSMFAMLGSVAFAEGEVANLDDFTLAQWADRCAVAKLRIMSANLKGTAGVIENSSFMAGLSKARAASMVEALANGQLGVADEIGKQAYSICVFVDKEMLRRTR